MIAARSRALPPPGPTPRDGRGEERPTFGAAKELPITADGGGEQRDIDAHLSLGQAIADTSGRWTLPTDPLAGGFHSITATITPPGAAPFLATNPPGSANASDTFVIDTG